MAAHPRIGSFARGARVRHGWALGVQRRWGRGVRRMSRCVTGEVLLLRPGRCAGDIARVPVRRGAAGSDHPRQPVARRAVGCAAATPGADRREQRRTLLGPTAIRRLARSRPPPRPQRPSGACDPLHLADLTIFLMASLRAARSMRSRSGPSESGARRSPSQGRSGRRPLSVDLHQPRSLTCWQGSHPFGFHRV